MYFAGGEIDRGVGGWGELYPFFWDFFNFLNFAEPGPLERRFLGNGAL